MKNLIVLMSLALSSLNVSAQTIVEVPEATDPVQFTVYMYDSTRYMAFKGVKATFVDGVPALITDGGEVRTLISFNISSDLNVKSTYSILSKNGAQLAKHEIDNDKLSRFLSLASLSVISSRYINGGNATEYYVKCPLTVEISRKGFAITKVTPACDDLF